MIKFYRDYSHVRNGIGASSISEVIRIEMGETEGSKLERLLTVVQHIAEMLPERLQEDLAVRLDPEWRRES